MDLTKEEFLKKYGFTEDQFISSELSWDKLLEIEADYKQKRDELRHILDSFMTLFIKEKETENGLHSFGGRTKDAEHLIAKIVRKRIDDPSRKEGVNFSKYETIDVNNYEYIITDLIGIRGLLLFREDWIKFHDFIESNFNEYTKLCDKAENDNKYILNKDDFEAAPLQCMLEYPKVYLREGDSVAIYSQKLPRERIKDEKYYRSVHYILKYQNHIIEVQIRTLFDEGWGEVDHFILYPNKTDNPLLTEYSEMMTRLTGMADEMASFFLRVQNINLQGFVQRPKVDKEWKKSIQNTSAFNKHGTSQQVELDCQEILKNSLEQ